MEKLNIITAEMAEKNIEMLGQMFPNCLTEKKNDEGKIVKAIDFDKLRQELADSVVEGPEERYQFTWPDKRNAIRLANAPTTKTLRPCREESVDFDNTQNLYIEGDNLDVLKILRENYLGKVKMIYIDPPYNTGNDFVYNDDFAQTSSEYIAESGQFDSEGNRLVLNTESNGRFHTDWLNMMYPRLKVAKDLLSDDGVIFISIDDNEVANLKKLCDEIFGDHNFVAKFDWRKKTGANDAKDIAIVTESILLYAKHRNVTLDNKIWCRDENSVNVERYKYEDEYVNVRGKFYYDTLDRGGLQYSDSMNFGIEAPDGGIIYPNGRDSFINDGWIWKWSEEKVKWGLKNKYLEFVKSNKSKGSTYTIKYKVYQFVDNEGNVREKSGRAFMNLITEPINQMGNSEMKDLFYDQTPFSNPKPLGLIKYLLNTVENKDATILDFFSGSATTAHSVMQMNADDNGHRKFIMVQLPEETDISKVGYKNICEIGKERIRRAGRKILTEVLSGRGCLDGTGYGVGIDNYEEYVKATGDRVLDIGFRVLKLDSANEKEVKRTPSEVPVEQGLFDAMLDDMVENIKEDRTPEDLLFQVLPMCNLPLSCKIETKEIDGKCVFIVEDGYLIACFDNNINETVITEIAKMKPYYFVMRDSSLATDNVADNFDQIFNAYSKDTIRRIL